MIIYKTTNIINEKIYVGKHIIQEENDEYLGSGNLLKRAVKKYGKENFIRETLEICDTKKQLNEREIYWIDRLNSRDLSVGYNISKGGDGGDLISEHPDKEMIIEKITFAFRNIGKSKMIDTKKRNNTLQLFGDRNPNFGNRWTEEQKQHASDIWKNKYDSGYIHPQKDKAMSEEQRHKLSESKKGVYIGELNPFFDKHHTPKTKEILSRKGKERGYVGQQQKKCKIDDVIYESLAEASRQLKIPIATILWRIRSKNPKFESYSYF